MTDPWDGVAWSRLVHFFGSAADLPEHFTAWLGGSVRERLDSGVYLRHADFTLGLWPATAPTAAVLADLLDGRGLDEEEIYVPLLFIDTIAHIRDLGNHAEPIRKRCELHADDITTWTAAYIARDVGRKESDALRRPRADEPCPRGVAARLLRHDPQARHKPLIAPPSPGPAKRPEDTGTKWSARISTISWRRGMHGSTISGELYQGTPVILDIPAGHLRSRRVHGRWLP